MCPRRCLPNLLNIKKSVTASAPAGLADCDIVLKPIVSINIPVLQIIPEESTYFELQLKYTRLTCFFFSNTDELESHRDHQ
jgi:hypothetical protein